MARALTIDPVCGRKALPVGADRERVTGRDLVAFVRHEVEMHERPAHVRPAALEIPDAVVIGGKLHFQDILTRENGHERP